ncbi:hypothetical protein CXB51_005412 [Gossypium anomalum]|uniref:Uncharacterized protein n=1 Tax=Gossypium anomalum TaxID=47600 RepID=A0A8J5ZDR2_9ROSI|nr:hypothetical protein CXB51_005412 [Gossypium anomalum]
MMRPRPSTQNHINRRKFAHLGSHLSPKPNPGLDWSVVLKPISPSFPGWPEPKSKPDPMVRPVSIEDQASELKGYYEENHEKGEFFYLVYGGIGENCINHEANTLQEKGSNKTVENLETGNSSGKVQKDASNSLDKGDNLNVISGGVEFVNADGNGLVKKEVSSNDHSNGELMACNMSNVSVGLFVLSFLESLVNMDILLFFSIVAFNVFDWKGEMIDPALVQKLTNRNNMSLCIGCLQHIWFSVEHEEMKEKDEFQTGIDVTTTIGFFTSFEDIYRLWVFVSSSWMLIF